MDPTRLALQPQAGTATAPGRMKRATNAPGAAGTGKAAGVSDRTAPRPAIRCQGRVVSIVSCFTREVLHGQQRILMWRCGISMPSGHAQTMTEAWSIAHPETGSRWRDWPARMRWQGARGGQPVKRTGRARPLRAACLHPARTHRASLRRPRPPLRP